MDRVGIYHAKARLSELIERVERGEEVTITKNRKVVARIVPARARGKGAPEVDRKAVMEEIRAFAKTVKLKRKLTQRELRKMREWGRD